MTEDADSPIVAEVRRVRAEIAKECDYDLKKLVALLKREEDAERAAGRRFAEPPKGLRR